MIEHLLRATSCGAGNFYADPLVQTVLGDLHPGGQALTKDLLAHLGPPNGRHLVDVGCGPGKSARTAHNLGYRVTGIDVNAQTLDQARAGHPPELQWVHRPDGTLPAELCPDVILSECALCLTTHPEQTLQHFAARLPKGGHLILSDVTLDADAPALRDALGHVACIGGAMRPLNLREAIANAGFEILLASQRPELIADVRQRIHGRVNVEEAMALLGDHPVANFVHACEQAFAAGQLSYAAIVARKRA